METIPTHQKNKPWQIKRAIAFNDCQKAPMILPFSKTAAWFLQTVFFDHGFFAG
jgi:hypothetical protein